MDSIEKEIYTAEVDVTGGRGGRAVSEDGLVDLTLARPGQRNGVNPEQLMAAGWGACFQSALAVAAQGTGVSTLKSKVRVSVTLGTNAEGVYVIAAELKVFVPRLELEDAQRLVEKTHQICPYSRATRGNIKVSLLAVPEAEVL